MRRILLYLTILVWPFGLLLAYQSGLTSPRIYYLDIMVSLVFTSVVFSHRSFSDFFKTKLFKAYTFFVLALIFSQLANLNSLIESKNITPLLYLIRAVVYPSLYLVARQVDQNEIKKITAVSLAIFVSLGVIQYLVYPDLRILKNLGFDDHYYRMSGSLLDPNFTGAILASASLYLIFSGNLILSLIILVSLALTFSRASYLSFLIPLVFGFLNKKNKNLKLLLLLPLLALLIYLIPKPFGEGVNLFRTFSIFSRFQSWQNGIDLFISKPIFGWGYNNITGRVAIDNSFILILATSGIVGFLSFLNLLKEVISAISTPSKIFVLSILVHSLFNNSFFFIWVMSAVWLVASLKTNTN